MVPEEQYIHSNYGGYHQRDQSQSNELDGVHTTSLCLKM